MAKTLIDFDALQSDTKGITLGEAQKELARELDMRRSTFARWARHQPGKAGTYRKQFQALAAVNDIILTMSPENWERRMKAAHSQTGNLFS